VLFVPDCTTETFRPGADHGGHDGEGRALRYLEWIFDPDPADTTYLSEMVYLLREGADTRVVHDRHTLGLFPTTTWLRLLDEAGIDARFETAALEGGEVLHMFAGAHRPG
jgi:hypothetical protein